MSNLHDRTDPMLIKALLVGLLIEVPLAGSLLVCIEWLQFTPHNSVFAACLGLTQIVGITVMSLFQFLGLHDITYWFGVILIQVVMFTAVARGILKQRHGK